MAVTPRALAELITQQGTLNQILDTQDRALAKYWVSAWDDAADELDRLTRAITASDNPRVSWLVRQRQAARAVDLLTEQFNAALAAHNADVTSGITALVTAAQQGAASLITSQFPTGATLLLNRVDPRQVEWMINRATQQVTARHYHLQATATAAMKRELTRAVPLGINPNITAERMVAAVHGEFNGGLHRARVIARTEQLDAYRTAGEATHQANSDVLKGWQWVANLSETTCRSCVNMHGTIHPLDEPGPLDHQQGRCARVPVTKSWKELGFDGIQEPLPTVQPGDGERWLRGQPEDVQQRVLGERGLTQWRAGDWPASQWSELRTTDGWRDSYGAARLPESAAGSRPNELRRIASEGGQRPLHAQAWNNPDGAGFVPRPGTKLTQTQKEYWNWRQSALSINTNGETLFPHEIRFAERFAARGELIEWIPRGEYMPGKGRRSSNDFIWLSGDLRCELKSPSPTYRNIKGLMQESVTRAAEWGVQKSVFVVDLGTSQLSSKLRSQLARYNARVEAGRISRLFVLYGDGASFEEIALLSR